MAEFGSVEWQEEQEKKILAKIKKGRKLTASDRMFIKIQMMHTRRAARLMKLAG